MLAIGVYLGRVDKKCHFAKILGSKEVILITYNMLTTRISPKKQITIPSEIFKKLGLEIGDYLGADIEEERIVFTPARVIPKNQAWFWTKEWQEKEKEAQKDIAGGKVSGHFLSGEKLVKSLKAKR